MTPDEKTMGTLPEAIRAIVASARPADPAAIARHDAEVASMAGLESRERRSRYERAIVDAAIPLVDGVIPRLGRAAGETPPPLDPWPTRSASAGFVRGPKKFLALLGGTGIGKTTAAAAAAFARLHRGPVVYVRERMLERWCSFARYDREWGKAVDCATLIVDELGTVPEPRREGAKQALLEMCDARSAGDRKTLVLGNMTEDAFGKYVDPRLLSRWHDVGLVTYIVGEDRRVRPRAASGGAR